MAEEHENHGHSVAAWTGVITLIVASALIALGVGFDVTALWIIGAVLIVIGTAAGMILSKMGFGAEPHVAPPLPADQRP